MSVEPSRPADSVGLWLILSAGLVACAALFAASRIKPPILFAIGFGLVIGLALRFLAAWLSVPLDRRTTMSAVILAAVGFGLCFGLGYRRAARERERATGNPEANAALAEALLKSFPDRDPAALRVTPARFHFSEYLAARLPGWPRPWPEVLWGAEWIVCVLVAGVCVRKKGRAPPRLNAWETVS